MLMAHVRLAAVGAVRPSLEEPQLEAMHHNIVIGTGHVSSSAPIAPSGQWLEDQHLAGPSAGGGPGELGRGHAPRIRDAGDAMPPSACGPFSSVRRQCSSMLGGDSDLVWLGLGNGVCAVRNKSPSQEQGSPNA